jgi:hypothetical protein
MNTLLPALLAALAGSGAAPTPTTAAAPAAAPSLFAAAQDAQVGDQLEFRFNQAPLGGRGVTSLTELRGKPVLIDFWGTR